MVEKCTIEFYLELWQQPDELATKINATLSNRNSKPQKYTLHTSDKIDHR